MVKSDLLDPNKMTLRQLQEWFELTLGAEEEDHINNLEQIVGKKVLVHGKGGSGKTTAGICIAYDIREYFGRPVVIVGTRMGVVKEFFGDASEIHEEEFIDQLGRINQAVGKDTDISDPVLIERLLVEHGVYLFGTTILIDEGLNLFDRQKYSDPMNQVATDFTTKSRHFHNTLVIFMPREEDMNPRALDQMNWKGGCFYNEYTQLVKVHLVQGQTNLHLEWDTEEEIVHAKYHDMFVSHNVVGFRATKLNKAMERMRKESRSIRDGVHVD